MGKIAIVTGGSSGIGKQAAEYLRSRGCTVYEFSRRGEDRRGIRHITVDVTDESSVNAAVEQVLAAEGRLDILVNNAGFGISGAAEFTTVAEAPRQLDVNFWGMVRLTRAVLLGKYNLRYIEAILDSWQRQGIRTCAELEAMEKAEKERRGGRTAPNGGQRSFRGEQKKEDIYTDDIYEVF